MSTKNNFQTHIHTQGERETNMYIYKATHTVRTVENACNYTICDDTWKKFCSCHTISISIQIHANTHILTKTQYTLGKKTYTHTSQFLHIEARTLTSVTRYSIKFPTNEKSIQKEGRKIDFCTALQLNFLNSICVCISYQFKNRLGGIREYDIHIFKAKTT